MAKLTTTDLTSLTSNEASAVSAINENFAAVEAALENTLSRNGATPNAMESDLDMNSFDILNAGSVSVDQLTVAGYPLGQIVGASSLNELSDVVITSPTTDQVLKYNGTSWINGTDATSSGVSTGEMTFTPPTTTTLSVQRTGVAGTISNLSSSRGIRLQGPGTTTNSNSLIYAMKAISSGSGGWNAIARLRRHTPLGLYAMAGVLVRDSVSGKSEAVCLGYDAVQGLNHDKFTNDTTFLSVTGLAIWPEMDFWLKVQEISGTRKWFVSKDGDFWSQVLSQTISTAQVSSSTHVGIVLNPNTSGASALQSVDMAIDCLSWSQTAL